MKFLEHNLKSENDFKKTYENVLDFDNKGRPIIPKDLKIFTIMDTDDCTKKQKQEYLNKKMFLGHWTHDYIVPIFNDENLEKVLMRAGIKIKSKKKDYVEIFPTEAKYRQNGAIELEKFCNKLEKISNTNMDDFIKCCINEANKNKIF
jgi:hypothetical protein